MQSGLDILVEGVATITNVLEGTATCEMVLTSRCGGGNVDIWLMCSGKGVGSDTTMDWDPCCKCNVLVENQSILIR